jgi:hypothetical protein
MQTPQDRTFAGKSGYTHTSAEHWLDASAKRMTWRPSFLLYAATAAARRLPSTTLIPFAGNHQENHTI